MLNLWSDVQPITRLEKKTLGFIISNSNNSRSDSDFIHLHCPMYKADRIRPFFYIGTSFSIIQFKLRY